MRAYLSVFLQPPESSCALGKLKTKIFRAWLVSLMQSFILDFLVGPKLNVKFLLAMLNGGCKM